jgi:hypothetical protein
MKKFFIFIIILGLAGLGYWFFVKNKDVNQSRCADGFRFVPSTSTCEPVVEQKKNELDFSKIKIKTVSGTEVQLVKDGENTRYTGTSKDESNPLNTEYISLDTKELIIYSEEFAIIPYIYNAGGTGQFVYIGLFDSNSNTHLDSLIIGDRISIESITVQNEKIKINFKDRLFTQSFAETPTIPTQLVLGVQDKKFMPIMQLTNADYADVEIKAPISGEIISDTLIVKGAIPGHWYFEANAQFRLLDQNYNEIGVGNIQALSDWMTTQRVPFEYMFSIAELNYKGSASIVIQSENVQGEEEGEKKVKRLIIPIVIK